MRERLTPLKPDGRGNYVCARSAAFRLGESVALLARVSGEPDQIRGTVRVGQ